MAELVDALDSKSCGSNIVRVQVPLRPPNLRPSRPFLVGFLASVVIFTTHFYAKMSLAYGCCKFYKTFLLKMSLQLTFFAIQLECNINVSSIRRKYYNLSARLNIK